MKIPFLSMALTFALSACSALTKSEDDPRVALKPEQLSATEEKVRFPFLTIMITREGDYYVQKNYQENQTEKKTILKSQGREPEALKQTITQVVGDNSGMPVQIAADKDSRFQSYVSLLDVLRKLGFVNITLKTQKGEPPTSESVDHSLLRKKYLSPRTRDVVYQSYLEGWRKRTEEVGNTSYPEELRRNKIAGSLLLSVDIKADGSLVNIEIARSSGHRILDEAAKSIVTRAAPFAPFPPEILKDVDILNITQVWRFTGQHGPKVE